MSKLKVNQHPWRMCSLGEHWHGKIVMKGNKTKYPCVKNKSKKEYIYSPELIFIANQFFKELRGAPTANPLGFGKDGNKYDWIIRGWTKFWNETLSPEDPLDANLVKALIATESGFREAPLEEKLGYGLMQITQQTRKILKDQKGELKDYLVDILPYMIHDPIVNIAAGTRWLFRKKEIATSKFSRLATWEETVAEYKSYPKEISKNKNIKAMIDFRAFYEKLKK